jgi:NAD(P)-dependent dehydrogenase (short-subunit alcohol dehydrogenase family)
MIMPSPLRVVVTGANKGIGLGISTAYAERGDSVVAACRTTSPDLDALGVHVVEGIELTDDAAVARLGSLVAAEGVDVLVCNAGINNDGPRLEDIVVDDLAHAFDVNTLGSVRVVLELLPRLRPGAKILLMSSMGVIPLGILGTRTFGNYGYRMSKAAIVSFGHALANDVRDREISVLIASPGRVDTPLVRRVLEEGRATESILDSCLDIHTVGRLFRDRLDELTVEDSPAWQRDPEGNPVLPAEIRAELIDVNAVQVTQAGQTVVAAAGS